MPANPLVSSKKCPHCQHWSTWQQRPADRCEHCGELLDPRADHEAHLQQQQTQQAQQVFHLDLQPEDGVGTRFVKRLAYGGQVLFAAIMSTLVALAAAVAA